jgi:hypothetical protein
VPSPRFSAGNTLLQQSTAIMSSNYTSNPYSNPPAYPPVRPNYTPNYGPQAGSSAISGPYMQYRADAYGGQRQQQHQQPTPAPPYSGNVISPSQHSHPQHLPDRTAQTYGPNGQYRQGANTNPDTPMYAPVAMTRGYPSQSYATESDSPQSHSSSEGPKE